jgi:hypothetical protein
MRQFSCRNWSYGDSALNIDASLVHCHRNSAQDSKYPWDYYNLVAAIPVDEAFIPLEKSVCPRVKKS